MFKYKNKKLIFTIEIGISEKQYNKIEENVHYDEMDIETELEESIKEKMEEIINDSELYD